MANDEHLARLRAGVDGWNAWRAQSPERGANSSETDLIGHIKKDLDWANLGMFRNYLSRTRSRTMRFFLRPRPLEAALAGANLIEATLHGADLRGARLFETTFANVDLSTTEGLDACEHEGQASLTTAPCNGRGACRWPSYAAAGCPTG